MGEAEEGGVAGEGEEEEEVVGGLEGEGAKVRGIEEEGKGIVVTGYRNCAGISLDAWTDPKHSEWCLSFAATVHREK